MPIFGLTPDSPRFTAYTACAALVTAAGLNVYLLYVCYQLAWAQKFVEMTVVSLVAIVMFAVLTCAAAIAIQFARGGDPVALARQIGDLASAFFQSSTFYYLSGIAFIVAAFGSQRHEVNSTLTFLLALLGVAILLYGTGSQAMLSLGQGSGPQGLDALRLEAYLRDKLKEPDKVREISTDAVAVAGRPVGQYANFAVAGGAAALTAFFGWQITDRRVAIREVFQDHTRYLVAIVEPSLGDLDLFRITARAQEGREMYVRTGLNVVYIAIPEQISDAYPTIKVDLSRVEGPVSSAATLEANYGNAFFFEISLADGSGECKKVPRDASDAKSRRWSAFDIPIGEWKRKVEVKTFMAITLKSSTSAPSPQRKH